MAPSQIVKSSLEVNELLSEYVVLHDEAFKPSLRRIIPLPGIFSKIDFQRTSRDVARISLRLNQLAEEIQHIVQSTEGLENEYATYLHEYVQSLADATDLFAAMTINLRDEAAGNKKYNWSVYQNDLAKYNAAVERYTSLGATLNQKWETFRKKANA